MNEWYKWEQAIYYTVIASLIVFNIWWAIGELS
jgi:hypothetical protein